MCRCGEWSTGAKSIRDVLGVDRVLRSKVSVPAFTWRTSRAARDRAGSFETDCGAWGVAEVVERSLPRSEHVLKMNPMRRT